MTEKVDEQAPESPERLFLHLWWAGGLQFECLGCGRCCRREGAAYLLPGVARAMARHLGQDEQAFCRVNLTGRYAYPSLADRGTGCVMLKGDRCLVYPLRPRRCATWPFWPEVLGDPACWDEAAKNCPGMNQGQWWSGERIAVQLEETLKFDRLLQDSYGR